MALFQQILIQPADFAGANRSVRFTRDDLHAVRENTLALIHQGSTIPLLLGHAAAGSVDGGPIAPRLDRASDREAAAAPESARICRPVGHLVDLAELSDGSLWQAIEMDGEALVRLWARPPRFTSPEIRPFYSDGNRRRAGPLIAHLALTDRPLCPGQTPLEPYESKSRTEL